MTDNAPGETWESKHPSELGMSSDKLDKAHDWLVESAQTLNQPFRTVVVRHGFIAAEWNHGMEPDEQIRQASAGKSFYSCMLGIAVSEGKIPSLDAKVFDYYPEM